MFSETIHTQKCRYDYVGHQAPFYVCTGFVVATLLMFIFLVRDDVAETWVAEIRASIVAEAEKEEKEKDKKKKASSSASADLDVLKSPKRSTSECKSPSSSSAAAAAASSSSSADALASPRRLSTPVSAAADASSINQVVAAEGDEEVEDEDAEDYDMEEEKLPTSPKRTHTSASAQSPSSPVMSPKKEHVAAEAAAGGEKKKEEESEDSPEMGYWKLISYPAVFVILISCFSSSICSSGFAAAASSSSRLRLLSSFSSFLLAILFQFWLFLTPCRLSSFFQFISNPIQIQCNWMGQAGALSSSVPGRRVRDVFG